MAIEFIERHQQTLVFANSRLATEMLVKYLRDAMRARAAAGRRGARLSRRLPAARAARDRAQAARWRDSRRGGDQCAGAGHRYRIAGRGGDGRISGIHCLFAGSAPGAPDAGRAHRWRCWWRPARRSISTSSSTRSISSNARRSTPTSTPDNLEILINHLKCAAFELPIRDGEKFGPHDPAELCRFLAEDAGLLHRSDELLALDLGHLSRPTPSACAPISSDNFVVVDITGDHQVIAEVSFTAALTTLHEKAIYLHEARQFQVEKLRLRRPQGVCAPRGLRLFHRCHRLHAGEGAGGVRIGGCEWRAGGARRCAGEHASGGVQEDEVLHHGKYRRGQFVDAGAGNAHHRVLAASSRKLPGAIPGSDAQPRGRAD